MKKILIRYNNRHVPAILLAHFDMTDNEFVSAKGLFGRIKSVFATTKRKYCLVFVPWKHQAKELVIIPADETITSAKLDGDDIVCADNYISPFTEEEPYYAEYKISNFVGCKFVFEYKNYIADIRNQCSDKPLEILYHHHPELLKEEFDEE